MSDGELDAVVVHAVAFDNHENVERSFNGNDEPVVENYDELEKTYVARCMERAAVEDIGWEHNIISTDAPEWRDEFADMDVGDEIEL